MKKIINLNDLKSDKPGIKYSCAKQAIYLSENSPKVLYPKLRIFIKMLDGENNVLRWTALIVIGNLSITDTKGVITKLVPRFIKFTKDKSMITAGNAVKALGKIAIHKPRLKNKIFKSLLSVEKATYYNKGKPSPECGNIMIGHVIDVFADFTDELPNDKSIMVFLKRHTKNRRPTVKKIAIALLNKLRRV